MPPARMETQISVLVVEDHQIAQKVAQLVLQGLDCKVEIASSGKAALDLFALNHYDLIFMDIGLPDIDGLTTTTNIRNHELKLNLTPIPIIGLTAHTQMRSQVIESGLNDFLVKPLTKENCRATLNKFVFDKQESL